MGCGMRKEERAYEYSIGGAGSAGCMLASRLTEEHEMSVLLLEAEVAHT